MEIREHYERMLALSESNAQDKEEFVFNGWATYRQVAPEIKFWRGRARLYRFLLLLS